MHSFLLFPFHLFPGDSSFACFSFYHTALTLLVRRHYSLNTLLCFIALLFIIYFCLSLPSTHIHSPLKYFPVLSFPYLSHLPCFLIHPRYLPLSHPSFTICSSLPLFLLPSSYVLSSLVFLLLFVPFFLFLPLSFQYFATSLLSLSSFATSLFFSGKVTPSPTPTIPLFMHPKSPPTLSPPDNPFQPLPYTLPLPLAPSSRALIPSLSLPYTLGPPSLRIPAGQRAVSISILCHTPAVNCPTRLESRPCLTGCMILAATLPTPSALGRVGNVLDKTPIGRHPTDGEAEESDRRGVRDFFRSAARSTEAGL